VVDIEMRNVLERELVATLSLCTVCGPSAHWLGLHAYSPKVQSSGLWNHDFTFDESCLIDDKGMTCLAVLVNSTHRSV
jgi:hypothetical protein